jgi:hypothetical protein
MFIRPMVSQTAVGPWEYDTLALAESSVDPWVDGDQVTITGGAVFLYMADVAADGYSGLIHKDPFNETGTLTGVVLNASEPPSDPDLWAYTDQAGGTQGVDYEFDTSGTDGRIRRYSTAVLLAPNYKNDASVGTSDKEVFAILDDAQVTAFTGTGLGIRWYFYSSDGPGTNIQAPYIEVHSDLATNWRVFSGGSLNDTGIAYGTKQRLWVYCKYGKIVIWVDANSTPDWSDVGLDAFAGTSAPVSQFFSYGSFFTSDFVVGKQVFGRVTVA